MESEAEIQLLACVAELVQVRLFAWFLWQAGKHWPLRTSLTPSHLTSHLAPHLTPHLPPHPQDKSESLVRFRMITVDTTGVKESLAAAALALREALLGWVATTWHNANLDCVDKFEEMVARMNET